MQFTTAFRRTALALALLTLISPALAASEAELRADMADQTQLFEHYKLDKVGDWTRIHTDLTDLMTDKDSVKLAVFERTRADGQVVRRIVFLGTDPFSPDLAREIAEYLPAAPSGKDARVDAARQMYVQAIAWATGIVNKARQDGALIEVVGYSRGAQFATVIAGRFDIDATNYAGMPLQLGLEFLDEEARARASRRATNVHQANDPARLAAEFERSHWFGSHLVIEPKNKLIGSFPPYAHSPAGLRAALLLSGEMRRVEPMALAEAKSLAERAGRVADSAKRVSAMLEKNQAPEARRLDARTLVTTARQHAESLQSAIDAHRRGRQIWIEAGDREAVAVLTSAAAHITRPADLDRSVSKYLAQVRLPEGGRERAVIQTYVDAVDAAARAKLPVPRWGDVFGGTGFDARNRAIATLSSHGVTDIGIRMLDATQRIAQQPLAAESRRSPGADRVLATIEEGQQIYTNLGVAADAMQQLSKIKPDRNNIRLWQGVGQGLSATAEVLGLATAISDDLRAWQERRLVPLRSDALDAAGTMLLTGTSIPGLDQTILGKGLLARLAPHLREAGLIKYRHSLGAVPTFGALDALGAVRDATFDGHVSPATVEKITDAAVGATWSALGLVVSGGNPNVASLYESAGTATAATLRAKLRDSPLERALLTGFDYSGKPFRELPAQLIDQYSRTADAEFRAGRRPQDWITFFGGSGPDAEERATATLRGAGVEGNLLQGLQRISDQYAISRMPRQPIAPAATAPVAPVSPAPRPAEVRPAVSGVDQDMKIDASKFRPAGSR